MHEEVDYWGKSRHYYYNPAGHLLESLDPLGNRLRVTCDKVGRIISKIANDRPESQETFRYDKRGLMVSAVNPAMSVSRQYDADGLLRQECQQQTALKAVLDYQYDRSHRLLTQHHRISNGHQLLVEQQLTYQYDEVGRLMSQQVDEHQPIRFAYDRQGRLISQRFTSSLAGNFSYNLSGQLQQQCWRQNEHQIDHIDYYYDEQGNLTQRDDSVVGTDRYFYDQAGQIIRHMDPMHQIHQWVYDATGDRYQTNAGNDGNEQGRQLSFSHNIHYRLDAAGQLVYRSSPTAQSELSWDAHGRLTAFTQENKTTHYQYDALRRRINKQLYNRQGQLIKTVYFIWDGDALVAEVTIDHSPHVAQPIAQIACFVYYPNSFVPLVLQNKQQGIGSLAPPEETGYYFYQTDPNGMPLRLRDEQGEVVWLAHYSTFGQVDRLYREKVTQPLRLQGQYFDEESGLHYNRHRYYDPEVGVFISADPIGLAGGMNTYQYAPNIFGWVDPLGLKVCDARYQRYKDLRAEGYSAADAAKMSKSSYDGNPLDWSRRRHDGDTTEGHVRKHEVDDLSKPSHGVFANDAVDVTNKAWAERGGTVPVSQSNGNDKYVIPYPEAGQKGGYNGDASTLNNVTIITEGGTNKLVTSFPS